MYIKQIYTDCLSQASYYIESDGESVIIDPIRDTSLYMDLIKKRGSKVKYIFETHFHADFISGHLDLSKILNASIVFGPGANTNYEIISAQHEQFFKIGQIKIQVLHTPGHTPESTCFLLYDYEGNQHAIFSGDTLFVGEVGRPDLAVSENVTKEFLASQLYNSLHNILMKLEDDTILYPGHGPGSSCGANIGKETISTIGEQRANNYVLQKKNKKEFLDLVLNNLLEPPPYFSHDAQLNKMGYQETDLIIKKGLNKILAAKIDEKLLNDVILLDVRLPGDFERKFIKGSINIGKTPTSFAAWVGSLIPCEKKIIIICHEGDQLEVVSRLARIGYENILGFITDIDDIDDVYMDHLESISASDILSEKFSKSIFLDVRNVTELPVGSIQNSINIPLKDLNKRINELEPKNEHIIYCAGGYRSMMAASILKKHKFSSVLNVAGGFNAILKVL